MNNREFAEKAIDVAKNYKTAYVWGTFGLVANASNMQRMINQYSKNTKYLTKAREIYGDGYFFDCVGLIKGILWGWCGNPSKTYGGATYASNGVPDKSADETIKLCSGVSTNFSNIKLGEAVWMTGHIGIYVGNGKVAEATPSYKGGVQITACGNIGSISGLNTRTWTKHGKLPWVNYDEDEKPFEWTETAITLIGTVTANSLNIRKQPTTSADNIIGKHANGDVVNISAKTDNGWYKVNYPNIGFGYISAEYVSVTQSAFADIAGHYAENHIRKLADYGIANGYGDGTFKPDNNITRAEFSSLVVASLEKACGYSLKTSGEFPDIFGHWAESIVKKLVACGIVNGFEDGTFKPDIEITRGQAAIVACNMLLYCGVGMKASDGFPDTVKHYAENHINSLKAYGVVNGYEDGTFKPENNITRGQAAMYIANCLTVLGK